MMAISCSSDLTFKIMKKTNEYYMIAVSGGPDSMALFDLMRKAGYNLICLHVNYQKRDSAIRDEMIVIEYCRRYGITLYRLNATKAHGNFQDFARVFRYDFFKEIAKRYQTKHLFVAHQLDDYLETALLQVKRGSTPSYYGLKDECTYHDLIIHRPLLTKTKKELEDYCDINNVPYGIDESNLSDDYLRNRIRHQIIDKMDYHTKLDYYYRLEALNQKILAKELYYQTKYQTNVYDLNDIKAIKDLDCFLRIKLYKDLSNKEIQEIKRQIKDTQSFVMKVRDYYVTNEYGKIYFFKQVDYQYQLEAHEYLETEYFKIVEEADSFHRFYVGEEDYPLTIRNYRSGDKIKMQYGTKRLSRYFIDHKFPKYYRMMWPVVLNSKAEIIFVPKIGCDYKHYSIKPNYFMVECLNIEGY